MSRTYRRDAVPLDCNCGAPTGSHLRWQIWGRIPPPEEVQKELEYAHRQGVPPKRACFCNTNQKYNFYTKRNRKRDKSGWIRRWHSSGEDRRIGSRHLRAKQKDALVNGKYDIIPHFRPYDNWMYW